MEQLAKLLPRIKKFQDYIDDVAKSNFPINISGLSESAKAHFVYATKFYTNRPVVVLTYNEIELKKIQKDLEFFDDDEILLFPKREMLYYDVDTTNKDISMQRLNVFQKLYKSDVKIILTTVEAVMQKKSPWLHYNTRIVKLFSKGHIDYYDPKTKELKGSFVINDNCNVNIIDDSLERFFEA